MPYDKTDESFAGEIHFFIDAIAATSLSTGL